MDCLVEEEKLLNNSSKEIPAIQEEDADGAPIITSNGNSGGNGESKEHFTNNTVKIGKFGDISKLMNCLASRNDSFLDLDLICADGKILSCHKFILGAQSTYLRQILLSVEIFGGSSEVDNRCKMNFPDVEIDHMEIILKFLYTG